MVKFGAVLFLLCLAAVIALVFVPFGQREDARELAIVSVACGCLLGLVLMAVGALVN